MYFPEKENFFDAGVIIKTHGLHGSILISLNPGHFFQLNEGNALFIELDGLLVPFIIEEIDYSGTHNAFVFLRHYRSLDAARTLTGKKFWLDKKLLSARQDKKAKRPDTLNGYQAVEKEYGVLGIITNVIEGKQALLVIDFKGKEVMFPLLEQTLDRIDHENRAIYLVAPEGLMDFYLDE